MATNNSLNHTVSRQVNEEDNLVVKPEQVSANYGKLGIFDSEEEAMEGQTCIWNLTFAYVSSMALKAACLLGIPDILAREGKGATLSLDAIASRLPSQAPNTGYLFRLLRFLSAKGIFSLTSVVDSSGVAHTKYGLTPLSKWLVHENNNLCFSPITIMATDKVVQASWQQLANCILDGGYAFEKAHGINPWSFNSQHSGFNDIFNKAMASDAEIATEGLLKHYGGFKGLTTLVDVGGGVGKTISRIVEQYPSIKGINYDLPHVVTTAPEYTGVVHIGGDMFQSVPRGGDAIFMKWIMHDWDDEHCIKILKNCRKALPANGKVIIVDVVLGHDMKSPFNETRMIFDMGMMSFTTGGRERTEEEWKQLLSGAGFSRCNIIHLPMLQSVIEVFVD